MAIFAFITGILLGASLIACTVAAHNSDEIDEIISAGLATAKLADNYGNKLIKIKKYIKNNFCNNEDIEECWHEEMKHILQIIDEKETTECQAIKK